MKKSFSLEKTRNIGIAAHIDAGKTTTTERILYYTGKVHRMGEVDEGAAVMDWMVQEQERGITITSAATTCFWRDCRINLIDTPGHVDFTVEVERSLRVLDGAIAIFSAVEGVEPQSETVWRQADKYRIPRITFVNKMDRVGANLFITLTQMKEKLKATPALLQFPLGLEEKFEGFIDLIKMKALIYLDELGEKIEEKEIPEELKNQAQEHHHRLLETLADYDEEILRRYLEEKEVEPSLIREALREATLKNKVTPVLCGASLKNKGVQPLLDAVVDFLPSPLEVPSVKGVNPRTQKEEFREASPEVPLSALVFKIMVDPYVGKLAFLRVYSGVLESGSSILNANAGRRERIGRLLEMHANHREERKKFFPGDIGAVVGLKQVATGDTLVSPEAPILLEAIAFPEPVISVAIEPKTQADQDKLSTSLAKLAAEDPTFQVKTEEETGQTIISGMGELHLEVIVDRLLREFKVEANVGRPQVAYRETIKRSVSQVEGRYVRQTGGRGQYGHVVINAEPQEPGTGFQFVDEIKGGAIPQEFIPAVEKGIREAMDSGAYGFPLVDIKVSLRNGSFHQVDSSDLAFKIAGSLALKEALKIAGPVLLEPIMDVEVVVPEEYLGEVMGDLNSRQAEIKKMESRAGAKTVRASVPLREMFGYATSLRSLTQGRASFTMQFQHYAEVPSGILQKVLSDTGEFSLVAED